MVPVEILHSSLTRLTFLFPLKQKRSKLFVSSFIFISKWKPCPSSPGATSVYQLIRIEAFSVYVNKNGRPIIGDSDPDQVPFNVWREAMERGLKTFNTGADPLKFSECMARSMASMARLLVAPS